jgi:glutamate racemase
MLGIYDSGLGGITVLNEISNLIPDINFQYLADTEILPLGEKTPEFVNERLQTACTFLFNKGCNLVILACNTASVITIRNLQQNWLPKNFPNKQILSITKPFTELLADEFEFLKLKKGLLLATKGTINSDFYQTEFNSLGFTNLNFKEAKNLAVEIEIYILEKAKKFQVSDKINPEKAILVANKKSGKEEKLDFNQKKYQQTIQELKKENSKIDYLVLACTHYPIVKKDFEEIFGLKLIYDPSREVAKKLQIYLQKHPNYCNQNWRTKNTFWITKNPEDFQTKVALLSTNLAFSDFCFCQLS